MEEKGIASIETKVLTEFYFKLIKEIHIAFLNQQIMKILTKVFYFDAYYIVLLDLKKTYIKMQCTNGS